MSTVGFMTDPRDYVGYHEALEAGLLPVVPEEAPAVELISESWIKAASAVLAGASAGCLAFSNAGLAARGVLWALVLLAWPVGWSCVAKLRFEKCRLGYTNQLAWTSRPPWRRSGRGIGGVGVVSWDARGCWLVDSKGHVLRPPDRTFCPPGRYPSPSGPGKWDYWTGVEWLGVPNRRPPWPCNIPD